MRRDTKRNLARLLGAVVDEVQEDPGYWSLQGVAARAEVGVATAYRYFSSLDELREAYTTAPPKSSVTSPGVPAPEPSVRTSRCTLCR